jgi:glyoxylase-like metal-dependent hydrolase (beta-lactamase superfamily II)
MKLHTIDAGFFKLDGGAMFGVVPKKIWYKLNPSDENNLCTWAMRCLLIEKGDKLILIDTGLGNKQDTKFFSHYEPFGNTDILISILNAGFNPDEITDVVLTHLHFDHCGGAVFFDNSKQKFLPTFKNAKYWTHKNHLNHAFCSNPREKASFLVENIRPLVDSGQLYFIEENQPIIEELSFEIFNGHTESMLVPIIEYKQNKIVYCADLIPSAAHLPVNFVMSYDIRPLDTMSEKEKFLQDSVNQNYILFFEHDKEIECGQIRRSERGKFELIQGLKLSEIG